MSRDLSEIRDERRQSEFRNQVPGFCFNAFISFPAWNLGWRSKKTAHLHNRERGKVTFMVQKMPNFFLGGARAGEKQENHAAAENFETLKTCLVCA